MQADFRRENPIQSQATYISCIRFRRVDYGHSDHVDENPNDYTLDFRRLGCSMIGAGDRLGGSTIRRRYHNRMVPSQT